MEQEKNNKGIIVLLVVIIVILLALVILLATGTVSFKSNEANSNQQTNENVGENNNIDLYKLEAIYDTLGIDKNETRSLKHCLNYNLSSNDYLENSKKIFSLYAMIYSYNEYNIPLEDQKKIMYCDVVKSDNCSSPQTFFGAAAARVISKPRANLIISKYSLQDTDFLMDFPHISNIKDDMYGYYTDYASGGGCDYIIKHSLDIQENETQDVTVVDKQTVLKLNNSNEEMKSTYDSEINQTVTYILKKNNNDYNLKSVSVK